MPGLRQLLTADIPGGSVSLKTPQLLIISIFSYLLRRPEGNLRRILARRTNYRNAFCHHSLICIVCMQISAAHEASLGRMSMYPAQAHQIFRDTVVEEIAFVDHLTCVASVLLLGNYNA
jgi:hypothetical protein